MDIVNNETEQLLKLNTISKSRSPWKATLLCLERRKTIKSSSGQNFQDRNNKFIDVFNRLRQNNLKLRAEK